MNRRSFIYKAFGSWIRRNSGKLQFQVLLTKKRKHYFEFGLSRVTPHIKFRIANSGAMGCFVTFKGEIWDALAHFDIYEARTSSGEYYCSECDFDHRIYYTTRYEFWEKHSFIPLSEWANQFLSGSNYLCFLGGNDFGFTESKIVDSEKLGQIKAAESFVGFVPILRTSTNKSVRVK